MYEQLDIFSYLEPLKEHIIFNPIKEFALRGSGFRDGKKRIVAFFAENENLTDRANFLKKEYGIGGFASPHREPFFVHEGWSDAKGCHFEYYDENMQNTRVDIAYQELVDAIDNLIVENRYKELSE